MRKDQAGFTLVELLIAVTIMAIVTASVCGFIIVGSKSYASGNSDISVQQEAQLALNQISDVLIDTTRSVNYAAYDDSGAATLGLKDAEFTFEPSGKSLTMFNGVSVVDSGGTETIEEGNGNKNYLFYWDKADETLYYSEIGITETSFPMPGENGCVVLAERVKEFSADLTQVEEKRVVQISMTFTNGNKEYKTSNNITIRNKVGINDVEIGPLDRRVELSVIPRELQIIIEPGETYHFSTPKVTGKNVTDKSVTWSMAPGYSGGTVFIDAANGIIQIDVDEPAGTIQAMVTTNAVDSDGNHATATVLICIKRVTSVALSKTSDENTENTAEKVSSDKKFTVSSVVSGSQLGVACKGCSDDTAKDFDVTDWVVEGPATLVESDEKEATFLVNTDATEGEKITIRATSYLSKNRAYPDVQGVLELTVAKSKIDLEFEGDIKYGRASKIIINRREFNIGGQGYYIVCARIKESQDAPASSDKIMLYGTNGSDAWMTPDLFGLDVSKTWYVSLQIIDPGTHFSQGDAIVQEVITDYENKCDSTTGTYNGKFKHTDKISCVIYPPQIYYNYKGNITSGQLTLDPMYATKGAQVTELCIDHVANTIGEPTSGKIKDYVKFAVYQGKGEDPASWGEPIYGYRYENNNEGYRGSENVGGLMFNEIKDNYIIKLRTNDKAMDAIGSYHMVPYIRYVNKKDATADHEYTVYDKNYEPNYEQIQFYEVPESTIHFEVKESNITLKAYYDNNHFTGGGYFPVPSDFTFTNYFQRNKTSMQTKEWQKVNMYCDFRNEVCEVEFKRITCEYIAIDDTYKLEFYYRDNNGNEYYSGKFRCDSDGVEWEQY